MTRWSEKLKQRHREEKLKQAQATMRSRALQISRQQSAVAQGLAAEKLVMERLSGEHKVVLRLSEYGNPDLLIWDKSKNVLEFVEVKSGNAVVAPHQAKRHDELRAQGMPVSIIRVGIDDLRM